MFEKTGIMSSPFEERVRYINALGEEVAQTLSQIDGVISARVHIVLPDAPSLGQPVKPSSAAVFIKHQPGVDLDFFQPQIRRLVSSAIEGLEYSAVTVVLVDAAPTKVSTMAAGDPTYAYVDNTAADWSDLAAWEKKNQLLDGMRWTRQRFARDGIAGRVLMNP
jgi:type III secretory pathway lipoprotein EscJ